MYKRYASESKKKTDGYLGEDIDVGKDYNEEYKDLSDSAATAAYFSNCKTQEELKNWFNENGKDLLKQQRLNISSVQKEFCSLEKRARLLDDRVTAFNNQEAPVFYDPVKEKLSSEREHFHTHKSSLDSGVDVTKYPGSISQNPEIDLSGQMAAVEDDAVEDDAVEDDAVEDDAVEDDSMDCTEQSDLKATAAYLSSVKEQEKQKEVFYEEAQIQLTQQRKKINKFRNKITKVENILSMIKERIKVLENKFPASSNQLGDNVASERRRDFTSTVSEDSGFGVSSKGD